MRLRDYKPWAPWLIGLAILGVLTEIWLLTQITPSVGQWLFDWQTLLAGALALAGALLTVHYLHKQIIVTENMEIERRRREENALKAILPMALSEIVRYSVECIKLLNTFVTRQSPLMPGGMHVGPLGELPRVQSNAVETIRDCTRYADPETAGRLATLLNTLQVQQARLRRVLDPASKYRAVVKFEAFEVMIGSAELCAKASALFEYGRASADLRAKSTRKEMDSAFLQAGIVTEDDAEFDAVLSKRYPETEKPQS